MPPYRRIKQPGRTYFFTVALADQHSTLLVDHIELLRAAYAETILDRPLICDAFVVLPNHLHAIWTLPHDADYSKRWGAIKARFVMNLRREGINVPSELPPVTSGRYTGLKPGLRKEKREAGVWQRRFWEHCIRNEADYARHMRYCWMNPVKHGFVEKAEQWPYSSIHRDLRLGRLTLDMLSDAPEGRYGELEQATG